MVTKRPDCPLKLRIRSVLAKIHMVTKPITIGTLKPNCSVLAKIHMVTKHSFVTYIYIIGSVLAKIHMVTKPQKYGSTFLNVIEY